MITVVATQTFKKMTKKILNDADIKKIAAILENNPDAGDVIKGSGGARKMRYALAGKGKSGGARIIHFYKRSDGLVFLLLGYSKSKKENLTQAEISALNKSIQRLK